jgi:hypothetical protein
MLVKWEISLFSPSLVSQVLTMPLVDEKHEHVISIMVVLCPKQSFLNYLIDRTYKFITFIDNEIATVELFPL